MKVSLCTVAFSVAGFVRDWNHCDQVADYLAISVSIDQPESFRHGNLLSPIINEMLETIHLSDRPDSMIEIEVLTDSPFVYVVMHVDSSDRIVKFYSDIMEKISQEKVENLYQKALLSKSRHLDLGILGVTTHYEACIALRATEPGRTAIEVSMALHRFLEVTQCLPISISSQ